jgi:hypothetical protein
VRVPLEITGLLAGRCKHSNVFSQAGLMDDGLCVFSCEPASDWLGSDNSLHTPAHLGWPTSHVIWFASPHLNRWGVLRCVSVSGWISPVRRTVDSPRAEVVEWQTRKS